MAEQCLRLGSDDLMAVACLVPGNVSVQRCRMLSCCGNALHEEALCKSLISLDLDLRHTAPGNKRLSC